MKAGTIVKKSIQITLALAALVVVIMWMSGMFRPKIEPGVESAQARSLPRDARVVEVEEDVIPVIEEASGTVEAKRKALVSSRILATIREITVRAGDRVAEGEELVVLDDRDLAARVEQAQRAVDAAQAAATRAEADFERASELFERQVIGRSEYDEAESAHKIAQAELQSAQQALQAAKVASSYASISAPVSGVVVERYAEPGDTASPGQPILALYDPRSLRIEAPVRESLLSRIEVGDPIDVRLGHSQEVIQGTVGEIVPEAEAGSRSFLVRVDLPAAQGLYTGMFARIEIPAGQRRRLLLDREAIESIGQLSFVTVVDEEGRLARRIATFGTEVGGDKREVLSGLSRGERIVVN